MNYKSNMSSAKMLIGDRMESGHRFSGISTFALVVLFLFASTTFAESHAFPVPFVERQHSMITFTDLPGSGSIKIFTIDGEEVANLSITSGELIKQWNVTNSSGKKLASGVYLYLIDGGNGSKTEGKLVVIR